MKAELVMAIGGIALVTAGFGLVGGKFITDSAWRARLVERSLGQYCPHDGSFAFAGECGKPLDPAPE